MIDPERLDLPSASSANRRARCIGSENLIRELRARDLLEPLPESPDAKWGTDIHAAWAGKELQLQAEAQATLEDIKRMETLVLADWSSGEPYSLLGREVRLWLRDGIMPVASGKYDVAYTQGTNRVLILDAKTLYSQLEPAAHNDQLRELVALLRFNYPLFEDFRVAILAPHATQPISIAYFDRFEAELALRLLRLSLFQSNDPNAPRTPGPWCKVCPAQLNCPELRALVPLPKETLAQRVERGDFTLPLGTEGSSFLHQIHTAKAVIKSLEEAYKEIVLKDPNALPGWALRNGKKIREISNTSAALQTWIDAHCNPNDFLASATVSITTLQARFGQATGFKGKRLTQKFNQLFATELTYKQYAPELVPLPLEPPQLP